MARIPWSAAPVIGAAWRKAQQRFVQWRLVIRGEGEPATSVLSGVAAVQTRQSQAPAAARMRVLAQILQSTGADEIAELQCVLNSERRADAADTAAELRPVGTGERIGKTAEGSADRADQRAGVVRCAADRNVVALRADDPADIASRDVAVRVAHRRSRAAVSVY